MEEFRIECDFGKRTQAYKDGKKFYVDYDDFINHVMGYSFKMSNKGYVMYSSNKDGLHNKLLHRIIMNCPDDMFIDHINRDRLNNMRSNLRIATPQQNMMNKGKQKNNTTGVIGVSWNKAREKWEVRIMLNNKKINLGYFKDFEDACKARKDGEIKYFGEFRNKDED